MENECVEFDEWKQYPYRKYLPHFMCTAMMGHTIYILYMYLYILSLKLLANMTESLTGFFAGMYYNRVCAVCCDSIVSHRFTVVRSTDKR